MGTVESKYIALFANSAESLKAADEDLQDKIDAFRVRFADLQDCLLGEQKIVLVYHDLSLPIQPIHEIAKTEGILLG